MSQLTQLVKQKYPMYANIPDDQLEQMVVSKYPQYKQLATPQKEDWLTGNAQSIPGKVFNAAGNILNLPSYAIGGVIKHASDANRNPQEVAQNGGINFLKAAGQGIKNKQSVMNELPSAFGVDPNSGAGMALGFGGELLTPNLPIGKIAKGLGLAGKGSKAINVASKAGGISEVGKDLLLRSYKFSQSDIKKLAENLGATDPSTYKNVVVDFLQKQKLTGGATQQGMESVSNAIKPVQQSFDKLTKTGGQVSRQPFASELLESAIKAEEADTPQSRALSKKLLDEAAYQESKYGKPLTDTELTKRITRLFSESGDSAMGDPFSSSLSKQIAKSGQSARETLRPGATELGRNLKGLRTAQEVVGRTANVGKGTQIINTLKPFVPGATGAYILSGGNPLATIAGAASATIANNPAIQNKIARATLSFANRKGSGQLEKSLRLFGKGLSKATSTGARVYMQPKKQSSTKQQSLTPQNSQTTYVPSPSPIEILTQQINERRKNYVPAAFPTVKRKK